MNTKLSRFFVACSGTTLATYELAEEDDQQKRKTFGIMVFIISLTSAIVASIAWAIPMGYYGFFVGIPWFFIVLYLERLILQMMDSVSFKKLSKRLLNGENFDENTKKSFSMAGTSWLVLRLLMIAVISYFNSEMIRVIMFKPEIVAEIKIRQDDEAAEIVKQIDIKKSRVDQRLDSGERDVLKASDDYLAVINGYNKQITATSDSITYWNNKLIYEVKGPGGVTGRTGDGPVAKAIRETIAQLGQQRERLIQDRTAAQSTSTEALLYRAAKETQDTARSLALIEKAALDTAREALIAKVMARPVNGLSFMLEVLNDIASRNPIIWVVFWLFFLIEAIPVLLKYFSKDDSFIWARALQEMKLVEKTSKEAQDIYESIQATKNRARS